MNAADMLGLSEGTRTRCMHTHLLGLHQRILHIGAGGKEVVCLEQDSSDQRGADLQKSVEHLCSVQMHLGDIRLSEVGAEREPLPPNDGRLELLLVAEVPHRERGFQHHLPARTYQISYIIIIIIIIIIIMIMIIII